MGLNREGECCVDVSSREAQSICNVLVLHVVYFILGDEAVIL